MSVLLPPSVSTRSTSIALAEPLQKPKKFSPTPRPTPSVSHSPSAPTKVQLLQKSAVNMFKETPSPLPLKEKERKRSDIVAKDSTLSPNNKKDLTINEITRQWFGPVIGTASTLKSLQGSYQIFLAAHEKNPEAKVFETSAPFERKLVKQLYEPHQPLRKVSTRVLAPEALAINRTNEEVRRAQLDQLDTQGVRHTRTANGLRNLQKAAQLFGNTVQLGVNQNKKEVPLIDQALATADGFTNFSDLVDGAMTWRGQSFVNRKKETVATSSLKWGQGVNQASSILLASAGTLRVIKEIGKGKNGEQMSAPSLAYGVTDFLYGAMGAVLSGNALKIAQQTPNIKEKNRVLMGYGSMSPRLQRGVKALSIAAAASGVVINGAKLIKAKTQFGLNHKMTAEQQKKAAEKQKHEITSALIGMTSSITALAGSSVGNPALMSVVGSGLYGVSSSLQIAQSAYDGFDRPSPD